MKLILLRMLTSTCEDGHFKMPLPLRKHKLPLPNNRTAAVSRMQSLKRRLDRDPTYKRKYVDVMKDLIDKGYAELAPVNAPPNVESVWYLPHVIQCFFILLDVGKENYLILLLK